MTSVTTRPPRVYSREHGKHAVAAPWGESGSQLTTLCEALAVRVLLAGDVKLTAELPRFT
jgi:hypothetical protein